jgi:hypothetical protein
MVMILTQLLNNQLKGEMLATLCGSALDSYFVLKYKHKSLPYDQFQSSVTHYIAIASIAFLLHT